MVAAAGLKKQKKTKQKKKQKNAASFVDVQRLLVPRIMCLFMENDFMYLLFKRLESGETSGLSEGGFVCGFVVRRAGVPTHAAEGRVGREEESDQESFPSGGRVTTPRG